MNRRAFQELNRGGGVVSARYMHQRQLLRRYDLPRGFGLCSALAEVWWEAARQGLPAAAALECDSAASVLDLVVRQCGSAWLAVPTVERPPAQSGIVESLDFAQPPAQTPLHHDLQLRYGVPLGETRLYTQCVTAPPVAYVAAAEPGLRLLSLRYGRTGHRMAFAIGAQGSVRFFDPNAGEVLCSRAEDFAQWFERFWEVAGYARRAPDVRLFRFLPGEPSGSSNHGG